MKKFALIHIGSHELYGMCFVASEIEKNGHKYHWFDGEEEKVVEKVVSWGPDFICFSPLSAFYEQAVNLSGKIKDRLPNIRSVFGGLHVFVLPEILKKKEIDIIVKGPVSGTIDSIVNSSAKLIVTGEMVSPHEMMPATRNYYQQIPRMGNRHVKMIMTHFGCAYNCSYCSAATVKKEFGMKNYKKHWLSRRSLDSVIEEAKLFREYPTKEVELSDDDMLYGKDIDSFLTDFAKRWKGEVGIPILGNVTPFSVLSVSDNTLRILADLVSNVCIGLQAVEKETLKLFNRQFQTKEIFKKAIDRLNAFDIPIKIDIIVGNPVKDPVADAIETIKYTQSLGSDKLIATVFPLMLYPGTKLTKWCENNKFMLNDQCEFNWYTGIGSIKFDPDTAKKIKNLSKLGHFFITHKVSEKWMRALIEMEIPSEAAQSIAQCNYYDSLKHHGKTENEIESILTEVKLYS